MKRPPLALLSVVHVPLRGALERMLKIPKAQRPFVILEDSVTGRFVQFATSGDAGRQSILIDVPRPQVDEIDLSASTAAFRLLGTVHVPSNDHQVVSFQRKYLTPGEAATLALQVMKNVMRLPPCAEVRVYEDVTFPTWNVN